MLHKFGCPLLGCQVFTAIVFIFSRVSTPYPSPPADSSSARDALSFAQPFPLVSSIRNGPNDPSDPKVLDGFSVILSPVIIGLLCFPALGGRRIYP